VNTFTKASIDFTSGNLSKVTLKDGTVAYWGDDKSRVGKVLTWYKDGAIYQLLMMMSSPDIPNEYTKEDLIKIADSMVN
jgi:hypothetical protein